MPDNPSPAAQPESGSEPPEFNFDKPATENPRIKRRSLKAKSADLKPATTPAAARELEREAPPLSTAETPSRPATPIPDAKETSKIRTEPAPKSAPVTAPPRTTPTASAATTGGVSTATATQRPVTAPTVSSTAPQRSATAPATASPTTAQRPASTTGASAMPANSSTQRPASTMAHSASGQHPTGQKVSIALSSPQKASAQASTTSPHGTRPATLYYSNPKKEIPSSMKPNTTAGPAASTNSSSSSSTTRPATAPASTGGAPASRPALSTVNIDYRTNVERQAREQRSVGNILSYFVYGLIAVFILGAGLAIYGSVIIFQQLHDESATISDLDAKYALKVSAVDTQLATTQNSLAEAQAQIQRQQDLLTKQQEDLNRLLAASSDNASALKAEARARAQDEALLRARIRDLESKTTTTIQRY